MNIAKYHPYIGITDFTSSEEVESMLKVFKTSIQGIKPRTLMIGTMMSYKTLHGLPTKWADVFPKPEAFRDIYSKKHPLLLNTLHYADYDDVTTYHDLSRAIRIAGYVKGCEPPTLDAIQLDMIWPDVNVITTSILDAEIIFDECTKLEGSLSDLQVILQVGSIAMERCENRPRRIAGKIKSYGNAITGVLFDRSGGLGKSMDAELLRKYILETKNICPDLQIAVAGGLGPETMHLIEPLLCEFPDLSFDAQSKLRKSGSALDPIDWDLAEIYLREAAKIIS